MMKKNNGFSLLELMMVIAVFAIVVAISIPSYIGWREENKLRGAANQLKGDLELARMRAVREGAYVVVQFTADKYTIFVDNGAGAGTAGDWIRSGGESIVNITNIPPGVYIDLANTSFNNNRTRFNARGLPDIISSRKVMVVSGDSRREVVVNRIGRINTT
jgi:type IV fimbrial biogenesis protein FimT